MWFGNERQNSSIPNQPDDPTISFGRGMAVALGQVVAMVLFAPFLLSLGTNDHNLTP